MKTIDQLIREDPNISREFKNAMPFDRCACGSTEVFKVSAVTVCKDGIPQSVEDKPICEICYYDQLGDR